MVDRANMIDIILRNLTLVLITLKADSLNIRLNFKMKKKNKIIQSVKLINDLF
jgi:hypothetical protein